MAIELTNATDSSLTLPPRRSGEYRAWLAVELANLAAYLGQQEALDTDGYRQAEMSKDLVDTIPAVMEAALRELRQECTFFPTTKEIKDAYRVALKQKRAADEAEEQRVREAEKERMRQRAKEDPEQFVSVGELIGDALRKWKEMPK